MGEIISCLRGKAASQSAPYLGVSARSRNIGRGTTNNSNFSGSENPEGGDSEAVDDEEEVGDEEAEGDEDDAEAENGEAVKNGHDKNGNRKRVSDVHEADGDEAPAVKKLKADEEVGDKISYPRPLSWPIDPEIRHGSEAAISDSCDL